MGPSASGSGSVRAAELDKFAALADEWWDAGGSFAPLHAMNPVRAGFVRDALCSCFGCAFASLSEGGG